MEKWRHVILKHFGRRSSKYWKSLMINIVAVDEGIKSAFLYDVSAVTNSQLVELLRDLKHENLIKKNLNVVEIESDFLVINVEEMLKETFTLNLQDRLIDVSKPNIQPCILNSSNIVNDLLTDFSRIKNCLEASDIKLHSLVNRRSNLTSIFGLLLNYPIIYWFNEAYHENCLSMEKLISVKISAKFCDKCQDVSKTSDNSDKNNILYSFSYPYCLNERCKPHVDEWIHQIQKKITLSHCFTSMKLMTDEIVLEAVCL
ncbi:hypothetical protein ACF0H5_022486 [Mactra antiquata]